jgi:hypothetical protein
MLRCDRLLKSSSHWVCLQRPGKAQEASHLAGYTTWWRVETSLIDLFVMTTEVRRHTGQRDRPVVLGARERRDLCQILELSNA